MKENLCHDDAVIGEAAGVAMGLVMLGTRSSAAVKDMIDVNIILFDMFYCLLHVVCSRNSAREDTERISTRHCHGNQ